MATENPIDRWTGRAANAIAMWPLIPSGVVGLVTYYLATGSDWVSQFGALGWWSAGLTGFLIAALALFLVGKAREQWAVARAARKWGRDVDTVNPLAREFLRQRIYVQSLAHPIFKTIRNKRLTDCELTGPANIAFLDGNTITHCAFVNCQVVIVRPEAEIHTGIAIFDCVITDCEISSCLIFMSQAMYDKDFKTLGMIPLTYEAARLG